MAATYGYGGEFSSDEDIDKIEQQSERLVQAKFDAVTSVKPTKRQIDEAIAAIQGMPIEQDVNLSDELLAGLLDHYKTQRGPIVDSTRQLYKRIVLRLVRNDQASNNDAVNGSANNNNNSIDISAKRPQPVLIDSFSSDDDEPVPPVTDSAPKPKLDVRVVYGNKNVISNSGAKINDKEDEDDEMEVDPETPIDQMRSSKQIDISSTEESSSDGSSDSDSSESLDSGPEVLDVTPIKPMSHQTSSMNQEMQKVVTMTNPKQPSESAVKRQPLAQSTPKEAGGSVKKPYTRSQRIAAASKGARDKSQSELSANSKITTSVGSSNNRVSRRQYTLVTVSLILIIVAFLIYHFRSDLIKLIEPLMSRKISF